MTQVVFCDFDGVIRHWDNQELFATEERLGVAKGTTFQVAFAADNLIPAITGKISDERWRADVTDQLAQTLTPEQASTLTQTWAASPSRIDHQIFELLNNLLPNTNLALVTNATSKLNADLLAHNLIAQFDFIINSSEIGVAKPDLDFYEQAVKLTNATLERSIFIDDSLSNVTSAAAFGLKAFHFQGVNSLHTEIEKWLRQK